MKATEKQIEDAVRAMRETPMGHLRSWAGLIRNFLNHTPFTALLPGKMRMTDIDGVCERGGRFFWVEKKNDPAGLTEGQRIMLEALLQSGDMATHTIGIILAGGRAEVWRMTYEGPVVEKHTHTTLLEEFKKWFKEADRHAKSRHRQAY